MKTTATPRKIVMLPLDERPCNFDYPQMMPNAGYTLVLPPKAYMGDKKKPADTARLAEWLMENIESADACILSLDTLIYGGIVPSRLHGESAETLCARARLLEKLRQKNAAMQLYVFQLIMRCPDYSLSDEEPDYYDECGRELHLYGRYTHLEQSGKLTAADAADFEAVKKKIKPAYLQDFLGRRDKNIGVLMHNLEYVRRGVVDFFVIPQDDSAVYGFTAMDQMRVREYLKSHSLHTVTAMYPSADDTGLALLARAVGRLRGTRPKVYVRYASSKGGNVVPWFEDRMLDETIKYHILAIGGVRVYSLIEADILLAVNMSSDMYYPDQPEHVKAYDIERNLADFVTYIRYALDAGKIVAVGDVATANGGDEELVRLMQREKLLFDVHGYAGWNTSSNTLGTTLCQAVLNLVGADKAENETFLLHRYYEDIGYMAYARKYVTDNVLPAWGLDYFHADGVDGNVAEAVQTAVAQYMASNYPDIAARVASMTTRMPWRRMFEVDLKLTPKKGHVC